ncbi:MAG TPA: YitT family protein [Methanoregulaceae archaeon]|nr:YitT family protein [Methanoregulaceae archaeon]
MPPSRTFSRYLLSLAGLFFMGLGIGLVTRSHLGTPPISSVPYVLSRIFPVTYGEFAFLLGVLFVLLEVLILGREFPRERFLQVFVGLVLGVFIDLGMVISVFAAPERYLEEVLTLVLGCAVLALGVYMMVSADTLLHPADAVVKLLARKTGTRFGTMKICFDASLCCAAALVSFAAFGTVTGLGEGTIVSALLVGSIVTAIGAVFARLSGSVRPPPDR